MLANELDDIDRFVLHMLHKEQLKITASYQSWLVCFTGTEVSWDTISRFLKKAFPYIGNLVSCESNQGI
jgi:hypothetical protein